METVSLLGCFGFALVQDATSAEVTDTEVELSLLSARDTALIRVNDLRQGQGNDTDDNEHNNQYPHTQRNGAGRLPPHLLHNVMTSSSHHEIYPAYTFPSSPTYNTWVKLTASDIHSLTTVPGFEGQNIFFHLNHPIRFVALVAPVVAIDDINAKYTILTLDDGSGATVECRITRVVPAAREGISSKGNAVGKDEEGWADGEDIIAGSNTTVGNLNVVSEIGRFDILVDGEHVDIGTVVKVKCTLGTFRSFMQLDLKRISIIHSTTGEVSAWREVAAFRRDVLSKPWVISGKELQRMERQVTRRTKREERRKEQKEDKRRAKERKYRDERKERSERRRLDEQKKEMKRRKEEFDMNKGALV